MTDASFRTDGQPGYFPSSLIVDQATLRQIIDGLRSCTAPRPFCVHCGRPLSGSTCSLCDPS